MLLRSSLLSLRKAASPLLQQRAPIVFPRVARLATRAVQAAARIAASAPAGPAIVQLFDLIERGLVDMCSSNAGFAVLRGGESGARTLTIKTGRGDSFFILRANDSAGSVEFSSPKSGHAGGIRTYKLDSNTGHWACVADGHFLLEILVRDLIHNVPGGLKGVPFF